MELPRYHDSRGQRWTLVAASKVTRLCPSLQSWRIVAESEILPRRSARAVRDELSRFADHPPDVSPPRFYLRGDEHHANDFYNVTEQVRATVSPSNNPDLWAYADRLAGRELLRTTVLPDPHQSLWSSNIMRLGRKLTDDVDVEGVLLASDWTPSFNARSMSWPWCPGMEDLSGERFPWVFIDGQPSALERLRLLDELRKRAQANLRALMEALGQQARLAVCLSMNKGRPWVVSPADLSKIGIVPVLDAAGCSLDDLEKPEAVLRTAETALAATPHALVGAEPAVESLLQGWGIAPLRITRNRIHSGATRGRVDPSVLVIRSREDGWSHAWDDATRPLNVTAARVVAVLAQIGVPCGIVDESEFDRRSSDGEQTALVVLAPARSLRCSTVERLSRQMDARKLLVAVEPVAHLIEGEASADLERLLARRRCLRIGGRGRDLQRDLVSALAKAGVESAVRLFRRDSGRPPMQTQQLLNHAPPTRYVTVMHRDESSLECLLEAEGQSDMERLEDGSWHACPYWHANEKTYAELEIAPDAPAVFRMSDAAAPRRRQ